MKCDCCKQNYPPDELDICELLVSGQSEYAMDLCEACLDLLYKKWNEVEEFIRERKGSK